MVRIFVELCIFYLLKSATTRSFKPHNPRNMIVDNDNCWCGAVKIFENRHFKFGLDPEP